MTMKRAVVWLCLAVICAGAIHLWLEGDKTAALLLVLAAQLAEVILLLKLIVRHFYASS